MSAPTIKRNIIYLTIMHREENKSETKSTVRDRNLTTSDITGNKRLKLNRSTT